MAHLLAHTAQPSCARRAAPLARGHAQRARRRELPSLALLSLALLLLPRGRAAKYAPFGNSTEAFALDDISKCASITAHLAVCLAIARTREPSRFADLLQIDEQTLYENACTHTTFTQFEEGARRFGAEPCLASAVNASADAGVVFLLIEGANWGISMADNLADPAQDWDHRLYETEQQRADSQAGLLRTQALVDAVINQLPAHAALRTAAAAYQKDMAKYFQPLLTLQCSDKDDAVKPCAELVTPEEMEEAMQKAVRNMQAQDVRDKQLREPLRREMAKGRFSPESAPHEMFLDFEDDEL